MDIVDKLIPSSFLSDSADKFKARSLIFFTLVVSLGAIITLATLLILEQSISYRRLISIGLISLQIIPLCAMGWFKNLKLASWLSIILTFILIEYVHYNNLSVQGPATIFFILPSIMAALLIGGKAVFSVTLMGVLALSFNYWALVEGRLPPPIMNFDHIEKITLITVCVTLVVVTLLVYGMVKLTSQREQELSQEVNRRQQMLIELTKAKEAAEASANSKAMFLATMSHELRTPLNSVIGNATLLNSKQLSLNAKERVDDIQLSGKLLLTIINDILELSKFDSKGVKLDKKTYDIADQFKQLHRMLLPRINEGVSFNVLVESPHIYVNADESRIAQIVLNFVSNATKFTQKGEITLGLAFDDKKNITIYVKDTGCGISENDQKNLFKDFVQVGDAKHIHKEGTGLGLAIVKRIVDTLEGTIQVESAVGTGTTIKAVFPVSRVIFNEVEEDNQDSPVAVLDDLSNIRVLIVDDVLMNCMILHDLLEMIGITKVESVNNGRDAVNFAANNSSLDLILMDVRMPEMNGIEACKIIRSGGFKKNILAVTANAFQEDQDECLLAGMDGFVPKPIDVELLTNAIRLLKF